MNHLVESVKGGTMKKRNVLLMLVDALRADALWGEYKTAQTNTVDSLRKKGTTFTQAIATTTTTTPSVASIFTGVYPFVHGIKSLSGHKLRSNIRTIAEIFKENGYKTYAEVTGPLLPETGLNRGFDTYHVRNPEEDVYSPWFDSLLKTLKEIEGPWFMFIHFWELHLPRTVPQETDTPDYGAGKYERALSALDSRITEVVECLSKDDVIVFHADHGEKITEPGIREYVYPLVDTALVILQKYSPFTLGNRNRLHLLGHGFHVYEYLVRVPLLFVGKGLFPKNTIIPDQVRQVDIFPTMLDALGLHYDIDTINGRSLMPSLQGQPLEEVPAYCEACGAVLFDQKKWLRGIRTSHYKYVYGPYSDKIPEELYDLKKDPHEKQNIVKEKPEIARKLREEIQTIVSGQERTKLKKAIESLKTEGKI
jgi:arylsulfatase A-like enzyme